MIPRAPRRLVLLAVIAALLAAGCATTGGRAPDPGVWHQRVTAEGAAALIAQVEPT